MISKRLQKAINLMMRRGGQVIVRTSAIEEETIGHDWSELLSKKRWPNDIKFHFSPWTESMFRQAIEAKLIRRDWEYLEDNETAYILADNGYLLAEQD